MSRQHNFQAFSLANPEAFGLNVWSFVNSSCPAAAEATLDGNGQEMSLRLLDRTKMSRLSPGGGLKWGGIPHSH